MSNGSASGAVYIQTNAGTNEVVAFQRSDDGGLTQLGSYETGGEGSGSPHLPSQGSVTLTTDGTRLLVTNVAGDTVSLFAVSADGGLESLGSAPTGPAPRSVAERDGLVYVLATGTPGLRGFRLGDAGLDPIDGADLALAANADPAQVGFTPDGSAVIVTERGTDSITAIAVEADGRLGQPVTVGSSGLTPYGFAVTREGTLVVTEAFRAQKGAAAASSYSVAGTTVTPVTASAGNGRSEICWAVATPDGRYAFTTNFADGAVSRYAIGADGRLSLEDAAAALTVDGRPGLRDEGLTGEGRFLYALDADSGSVFGWAVAADGALSALGSWAGLPSTAAGLACR